MIIIGFDILKVESVRMGDIVFFLLGIIILSIVYRTNKYRFNKSDSVELDEGLLNLMKFTFYFFLAGYIYLVFKAKKFPEIDVLTFLTFLLACFEATHNFINSIGDFIACFLSLILKKNKNY